MSNVIIMRKSSKMAAFFAIFLAVALNAQDGDDPSRDFHDGKR